jgi:hypothetical protein
MTTRTTRLAALALAALLAVAIPVSHWWLNRLSPLEERFIGVWYLVQQEEEAGVATEVLRLVEFLPDRSCRVRSLRRSPHAWDSGWRPSARWAVHDGRLVEVGGELHYQVRRFFEPGLRLPQTATPFRFVSDDAVEIGAEADRRTLRRVAPGLPSLDLLWRTAVVYPPSTTSP